MRRILTAGRFWLAAVVAIVVERLMSLGAAIMVVASALGLGLWAFLLGLGLYPLLAAFTCSFLTIWLARLELGNPFLLGGTLGLVVLLVAIATDATGLLGPLGFVGGTGGLLGGLGGATWYHYRGRPIHIPWD